MDRPELIFQDIDSEFVKDEFYEDFQAPKFYDFCLPHQSVDADNWFRVSSSQSDALNAVPETFEGQDEPLGQEVREQAEVPAVGVPLKAAGPKVAQSATLHREAEEDLSGLFDKLLHCGNAEQPKMNEGLEQHVENPLEGAGSKVTEHKPSAPVSLKLSKPERKRILPRITGAGPGAAKAEIAVSNPSNNKPQKCKKRNISQAGKDGSNSSLLSKQLNTVAKGVPTVDQMKVDFSSTSSIRLQQGCFPANHKKLKTTCPRPFRLLTESGGSVRKKMVAIQERGALKELEFNKKMEQYLLDIDKFQPASSFGAPVNYAAWGASKPLMPVVKDPSKDQKSTSEKGARYAEPAAGRSVTERKVQEQKQGTEKELQSEAIPERKCSKQVDTKNVPGKKGGHDPLPYKLETEPEVENVLALSQAYGNSERGALKEIKHNRKSDNLAACPGENFFHTGEAAQASKNNNVPVQKSGKEDRITQKSSVAHTLKLTGDFFFQAQRSLKKLTVPRAPKLHLPRSKRDCGTKQVKVD